MKIAVIGGTGLIGSAIATHLSSQGHSVYSLSRRVHPADPRAVKVDLSQARSPSYWISHLNGMEAVVNCAGVLQDSHGESTSMVHHRGVASLLTMGRMDRLVDSTLSHHGCTVAASR
jgi:uncharacterized protein YbjT (DUF2867 family)